MMDINEGNTNNYLIHGVFLILFGFVFSFINIIIGAPFILIALILFTSTTGIIIDTKNLKFKPYSTILSHKHGNWVYISEIEKLHLELSIERAKTNQAYLMGERGTSRSMTFDLTAVDKHGKKTLIYEFLKYSKALKAYNAIESSLNIECIDSIADKMRKNKLNRR